MGKVKKRLIIAGGVVVCIIALMLTLCFAVFTIKTVDIDFRTSTSKAWDKNELIDSCDINYGKCLLFLSKKGYEEKLEKENPYLEVINIETVFPSKLVIHLAERQELYAINDNGKMVYLDKDLKVLKIVEESYVSTESNAILLSNLSIEKEYEVGDFLSVKESGLRNFLSAMIENSKTLNQTLGFCKNIAVSQEINYLNNNTETNMEITTFSDRKITIKNIDVNLNYKLQRVFQTLPRLYETLVENGDYTNEEVDRCAIVVGNQITNTSELYVHIYLDGNIITRGQK